MPRLETPRLILREVTLDDAVAYSAYNEKPEFYRYIVTQPTAAGTRDFVAKGVTRNSEIPRRHWQFTIVLKDGGDVFGDIILGLHEKHPEHIGTIGYGSNPAYHGQGLMTEALTAVTAYGHDVLKLPRLTAAADLDNPGSWRVMEKCGYVREGIEAYAVKTPFGWTPQTVQYASVRPELIAPSSN